MSIGESPKALDEPEHWDITELLMKIYFQKLVKYSVFKREAKLPDIGCFLRLVPRCRLEHCVASSHHLNMSKVIRGRDESFIHILSKGSKIIYQNMFKAAHYFPYYGIQMITWLSWSRVSVCTDPAYFFICVICRGIHSSESVIISSTISVSFQLFSGLVLKTLTLQIQ